MTKYVVVKAFYDRLNRMKLCRPGDPHEPSTAERADHLVTGGFIQAVDEQPTEPAPAGLDGAPEHQPDIKHLGGGYWELPNGERVRGKEQALERLREIETGDPK